MSWRILLSAVAACGLLGPKAAFAAEGKAADREGLAKERLRAARHAYEVVWARFKPFDLSKGDGEDVYRWSRRWMESERDFATTKAGRVAAVRGHVERMKKLEQEVRMYARGTIPFRQLAATQFYRAEAELWLLAERAK